MAEQFWKLAPNAEAILAKLGNVSGEARKYAGTDFFAASRAVVLTRMLYGDTEARQFADGVSSRYPASQNWTVARDDAGL
jgi:hypothetical protein